jgi:hypothetical protein
MRMLLGFIEARAVVIDAVVKAEGTLHYLSVLCSSAAAPTVFSAIMRKTVPSAIIEETEEQMAEEWVYTRSLRSGTWNSIPLSGAVRVVNDSRRILISLLLEYRALIAEYATVMKTLPAIRSRENSCRKPTNTGLVVSFLIYEKDGSLFGLPDYQIAGITKGANGSNIIELVHDGAQRLIVCDELVCMKEILVTDIAFGEMQQQGYYAVNIPVSGGVFGFTLVVPAFL